MKNPPDLVAFLEMGLLSSMSLATGLFMLSGFDTWISGENATRFTIGVVACFGFSIVIIALTIVMQVILRPKQVEVKENIVLHWRFKGTETVPLDFISDLVINPGAPGSIKTRWTGGSIGFKGMRVRIGLTYDIVRAIQQKYFDNYGHYPPLPSWYKD